MVCGKIWFISHRVFRLTDVVTLVPSDRCGCGEDPAYEVDYEVSSTLLHGLGLGRRACLFQASGDWIVDGLAGSLVLDRQQRPETASMCGLRCLHVRERERESCKARRKALWQLLYLARHTSH